MEGRMEGRRPAASRIGPIDQIGPIGLISPIRLIGPISLITSPTLKFMVFRHNQRKLLKFAP